MLGLEICADTMVGDEILRGISGGQRKRVTTGTKNSNTISLQDSGRAWRDVEEAKLMNLLATL